jgi:hypothetical protein
MLPIEEKIGTIGCIVNKHVDGGGVLQLLAGICEVEPIAQFWHSVYQLSTSSSNMSQGRRATPGLGHK